MAFRSEAQRRKLAELVKDGKVSQEHYDEMTKATRGKLPERAERRREEKVKSLIRRRHSRI